MRRDEFEGESQGSRGRKRGNARPASSPATSRLRRLTLENLERRELLATTQLPTPTLISAANSVSVGLTALPNSSAPTIVVDPVDPSKLAASWNVYDPNNALAAGANKVTGYVQAAYSLDGGTTWTELPGDTSADVQLDPSQSQSNGSVFLTRTTDATLAFGRDQNVYLLSSTHNDSGTVGFLDLQRFDLAHATATSPPVQTLVNNQLYGWYNADVATSPTISVDSNVPSFTDINVGGQTVTQRDAFAGNVYVAWSQADTPLTPTPINFQPNTIKLTASSDQGTTFTHEAYVDNTSNVNFGGSHSGSARYAQPTIAISQGTSTIPGGQVSIVYDDYGTGAKASKPFDIIDYQTNLLGGTSSTWSGVTPVPITLAIKGTGGTDTPQTTVVPVNVNITDPKFTTLQALDISLQINYPVTQDLLAILVPPTGSNIQPITLFSNGVSAAGTQVAGGLTGANLGESPNTGTNPTPGTVFDQESVRPIGATTSVPAPYLGHFQPSGEQALLALQGLTAAQLNGSWSLQLTAFRNEVPSNTPTIDAFTLNFSSGNNPGINPSTGQSVSEVRIADNLTGIASPLANNINPAVTSNPLLDTINTTTTGVSDDPGRLTTSNIQAPPVLPSPSIAIDNTLGSFSAHQGRIYVAYTGHFGHYSPDLSKADTEINLVASDDGGKSWFAINPAQLSPLLYTSSGVQVNDANSLTDGYSSSTPGNAGRPAIQAQVAVDQSTGALVVSYLDTRHDPSEARVSTYIAVSNDGGNTFSPQTYANPSTIVTESPTGAAVNLGPVPDNQSSGNENRETVYGFGQRQGLAVANGRIFAAWSSNQNAGSPIVNVPLSIVDSVLSIAGGPRIVSSTMGPVGLPGDTINTTVAADGSPVANSFEVTFDRPIDPATFQGDGATSPIGTGAVRVFYQDPYPGLTLDNTTSLSFVGGLAGTSNLTPGNLPGESIVNGTVSLSLSGYTNLSTITATLTTPNGQTYTIPINTIPNASSGSSFTNASFVLPANIVGGPISEKDASGNLIPYKLTINPNGQIGVSLVNWEVKLNGISTGLRVLSVTPVPDLTNSLNDGALGFTTFKVVFQPINPGNGVTTSVGTYSYVVRPNLSDRIRQVGAPILSTGVTGLVVTGQGNTTASNSGIQTTSVTVLGHPNQVLVSNVDGNSSVAGSYPTGNIAGNVTASIVLGGTVASTNIAVFISTPDGERFALNSTANGNTITVNNQAFSVASASISLDGVYTLEVFDQSTPGNQSIQITAFQMTLNSVIQNMPAVPITVSATAPQVPLPIASSATTTSTITVVGHSGASVAEGVLNLSLTATDVSTLVITLTDQAGAAFVLPASSGTFINGQFLLPIGLLGQTLDGTYKLKIVAPAGNLGTLTNWSLTLTSQNDNLPATTIVADTQPLGINNAAQLPAPLAGTNTSMTSLFLVGHPGKVLEQGTITVNLTDTNVQNLTIVLENPLGQMFTLPKASGTALGQQFSLPASFIGQAIDGQYQLFITGAAGDIGLLTGWSLSLTPQGLNGNSMDQNANGTGGEDQETTPFTGTTPGDDYAVPGPLSTTTTTYNTAALPGSPYNPAMLPLIVTGAHVVTTNVTGTGSPPTSPATTTNPVGATTGVSSDALVVNDTVGAATVVYDRNVQIASVTPAQVLSIQGPAGSISSPRAFTSTAISNTFASTDVGRNIPNGGVASPLVSVLNIFNTGLTISSLSVNLDITDPNDQSLSITLQAPDGTLIPLAINVGGAGANFTGTIFSNTTPPNGLSIPIASGIAPFSATYVPATTLTGLAGKSLDGTWSLIISDNSAAGTPAGRLNGWGLGVVPHVPQAANTNLTSNLTITNPDLSFKIGHLAVQLNITAPKDSDVGAILVAPDGSRIVLFNAVGGSGSNFINTIFDDGMANVPIANGSAPFTGIYQPLNLTQFGFSTLTAQNGKAINGTWKLIINDQTTDGLPVTLNAWSLIATPQITVVPSEVYTSTDTSTTSYVSTDISQQIYQSSDLTSTNDKIPTGLGQSVSSNIQFTPSPVGTANPFLIANLAVALSITDLHDTNVSVTLIAPNGATVPLFAGVGGQGANFGGASGYTILSDSGIVPIASGIAPFSPNTLPPTAGITIYRPSSKLSVLDGLALNAGSGTWTLRVTNNRTNGPAGGTFNGWAMLVTPQNAPAANGLTLGAVQPVEPIPVIGAQPTTGPASSALPLSSVISFPLGSASTLISSDAAHLLSATLSLSGPNLANLSAVLISPSGVQATLFTAGSLTGTSITKSFTPLNAISGQGQFDGVPLYFVDPAGLTSNGNWTLQITDNNAADGVSGGGGGGLLTGWSLGLTPQAVAGGQASEPIPISPASSLSSTITITDSYALQNLRLRLDLAAPKDSDLSAMLIGPNGKAIQLFTNIGGSGVDFANTLFDDNALASIDSGIAPFSGTYRPENALANFVNGGLGSAAGTWTLVITDNHPLNASGLPDGLQAILRGWSLINTPPSTATLANSYQFSFPTQQLSGTYSLTLASGIIGADPSVLNPMTPATPANATNPALGFGVNPNLNAGVDILTGKATTGTIATAQVVYNDTALPVAVVSGTSTKGTITPGVLTVQVNVPDNFLIQGITSAGLAGLTVTLNITYPNDPDLSAILISPTGTQIRLFSNVGNGASRSNFGGVGGETIFDDTVNPLAPIASAGAPFFGRFNPQDPLSNLAGETSGGLWTLQITDNGTSAGTLNNLSLTFQRPLPSSGLGDPVADRQTVNFRIFNIAPTNPLANDTWTAVGPAGITTTDGKKGTFAGAVASIAYDPSDPTRNTVFVGSASGGIWKTTNFLTSNPGGPTYVPLTDFGPNFGIDIGSISVLGRNSDPNQSIVIAGTGFAEASYPYIGASTTYNNYGGNAVRGVGFLRSFDGGQTFTLLDSTVNVDSSGNPLPENSPLRDHHFVGDTTYKVVVDPTPQANGDAIIYAALGGPTGGLYRSLNTGNTWQLLSGGSINPETGGPAAATDVILDLNSKSTATGNVDSIYAAFQGLGVYESSNQGQGLFQLTGMAGMDPLLVDNRGFPTIPVSVGNAGITPNGAFGRIVLAMPTPTQNVVANLNYEDWLYAAVENTNGTLNGLYVTRDRGQNWTRADLGTLPTPTGRSTTYAFPTNDNTAASYDPTANQPTANTNHITVGNYAMTLVIDPSNPNIVYLGGSGDFQDTGLIRIDLTNIYDAHNYTSFSNERNDGGKLTEETVGAVGVQNPTTGFTTGALYPSPPTSAGPTPFLDLRHAPNNGAPGSSPFDINATLNQRGATGFTNDGTGVTWTYFDEPLKANAGDPAGSTNLHGSISFIDPVTGNVRLVFADDQGVFTALVNPNGTLDNGIGTDVSANYSRNGNLQNEQFYYGAAQPSNVAAQAAGALFYASGQGILAAQSNANVLNNGDITWTDSAVLTNSVTSSTSPRNTLNSRSISTFDRSGVGIATDPTGNTGTVYEFDISSLGGSISDFFRVNQVGRTTGLDKNIPTDYPFSGLKLSGTSGNDSVISTGGNSGLIPEVNFTVNPLNASQVLISSNSGTLYETTNQGIQWLPIGTGVNFGQVDGSQAAYASSIAYGAPDPSASLGVGNFNNFIYVGTVGGNGNPAGIFVTTTGGQAQGSSQGWINISAGLDGASVIGIYPSPNRGSHEAYAVTLEGVFYTPNSLTTAWSSATGNLKQIQHNSFGNASLAESVFSTYGAANGTNANGSSANAQYGGFRSIVADYRYAIPDLSGGVHPVLYVAGYGGVFRSLDNGQTWTVFPNTAFDSAPVDGGYLPSVDVTNLQLNLGAINPQTGRPIQIAGDPEVLLASTFGRGEFAIRLAPDVFPTTIVLDPNLPAPTGSDSGSSSTDKITNVQMPYIDGVSEISNFGNTVTITFIDQANGDIIATGKTDAFGRFSIQVGTFTTPGLSFNDPSFLLDGLKTVGIQATDSAGAKGNVTTFTYTLKHVAPASPGTPVLEAASDSFGANGTNQDDLTNVTTPTFDISTLEPGTTQVELLRSTSPNGPFTIVNTAPAGVNPVKIVDVTLAAVAPPQQLNQTFYYEAIQIDIAGNQSLNPSGVLKVVVDNIPPAPPTGITLDPKTNSSGGSTNPIVTNSMNPLFDVTGILPGDQVFLYRSINGGTSLLVGSSAVNNKATTASTTVFDVPGIHGADGVYTYEVLQVDVFGNQSLLAKSPIIAINDIQTKPAAPTLIIFPTDDTGAPTNPGITRVNNPRFFGSVPGNNVAGLRLDIINVVSGQVVASTTVATDGSYLTQIVGPVADGTYTLEARTTDRAGNSNFSAPLTLTIKHEAPQTIPTLALLSADDTGLKGDGVTANRRPHFIGTTNPGVTVKLYAVGPNGSLTFEAQTVSSTINGSFTLQLPSTLVNGTTQLVAQASDIAGNVGQLSPVLNLRVVTVASDYYNTGTAQLTVFDPKTESYIVRNAGQSAPVDPTPGRDVPVQNDLDSDGRIDLVGYRFNTAEYVGTQSSLGVIDRPYGQGGVALPVSGYYSGNGNYIDTAYYPNSANWVVNLPIPGGITVQYGIPNVDIPAAAAYNGGGLTEVAVFRPINVNGVNGDTFYVYDYYAPGASSFTSYSVGFQQFGNFTYKVGDIPAPADYDGVGHDEFAIYRPTTGQFFIANTPNPLNPATWTLETKSLNLPGGPNSADQPASADYDGNGHADPTVYRPSNSTFYVLHGLTGTQDNVVFGTAGNVAAAGPLLYRLSALTGQFQTKDGYPQNGNTSYGPPTGGLSANAFKGTITTGGGGSTGSTVSIVTPAVASPSILTTSTASATTPYHATVLPKTTIVHGVKTPKVSVAHSHSTKATHEVKLKAHAKVAARPKAVKVESTLHATPAPSHKASKVDHDLVASAIHHIGSIKKGHDIG